MATPPPSGTLGTGQWVGWRNYNLAYQLYLVFWGKLTSRWHKLPLFGILDTAMIFVTDIFFLNRLFYRHSCGYCNGDPKCCQEKWVKCINVETSLNVTQVICGLQARLTPYFHVDHPTRGSLSGPYKKLPQSHRLRFLCLDLVVILLDTVGVVSEASGLVKAVDSGVPHGNTLANGLLEELGYWTHLHWCIGRIFLMSVS